MSFVSAKEVRFDYFSAKKQPPFSTNSTGSTDCCCFKEKDLCHSVHLNLGSYIGKEQCWRVSKDTGALTLTIQIVLWLTLGSPSGFGAFF